LYIIVVPSSFVELELSAWNHANRDIPQRQVELFGATPGHAIEHEQGAARLTRLIFDSTHEGPRDSATPGMGMHKEFLDLGAMRLIGRSSKIKLHRAHDLISRASKQNPTTPGMNGRQNLLAPERFCFI
jgi:hypothetical protein